MLERSETTPLSARFFHTSEGPKLATVDLSSTNRKFVNTCDEARTLLAAGLTSPNKIKSITLSTQSFKPHAAPAIAELITNNRNSLRNVNLSDIVSGQPHKEAMDVIQIIADALKGMELDVLDLSDQALSVEGIKRLAPVFATCKIQTLKLNNVGMSWEACALLNDSLDVSRLTGIEVHNNMMCNNSGHKKLHPLANIISKAKSLQHVRISTTRIQREDNAAILGALLQQASLISLDLSDTNFSAPSAKTASTCINVGELLFEILKRSHKTLRRLILNDSNIGNAVIAHIKPMENLQELGLNGCELNDDAVDKLILYIVCGTPSDSLKTVSLTFNDFDDEGLEKLLRTQKRLAGQLSLVYEESSDLAASDDSEQRHNATRTRSPSN